jgi:hypothetical protein
MIASQARTPAAQAGVSLWMQDESVKEEKGDTSEGDYEHDAHHRQGSANIRETLI